MKNKKITIAVAADHAGYPLKEEIIKHLHEKGFDVIDCGTTNTESCDYPDFALSGCCKVLDGLAKFAILICGTGVGMSIAANKLNGIRAACVSDAFSTEFTRKHNDANCLCLGARVVGTGLAEKLVDIFTETEFEGGKHQRRIDKIANLEK